MFLISLSVNAFALNDCRVYQIEHPELEWKILTELKVSAVITELDAILCAGFDDEKPILVSYRDSSGSDELFPVKDLIQKPTVILTDEDINVGGVIKKGNIMSLYMEEVSESRHYILSLNFLRNLAFIPSKRDERKLSVELIQDETGVLVSYYKKIENSFKEVEIIISATLNISEVKLFEYGSLVNEIDTKILPKATEL
tara:strand:- start:233 stop:829 length:597 start_codon:yes stop_codon:yes gene_type:complete